MLHKNIIEQGGFRKLDVIELDAVSGGYYGNDDPIPGQGDGGFGSVIPSYIPLAAQPWTGGTDSAVDTNGDFRDDNTGENVIIVTPNIQNHGTVGEPLWAHLNDDGTYVQFTGTIYNHGIFGLTYDWSVAGHGTWTQTFGNGAFSIGLPVGVSWTFGSSSITFDPAN